MIDQRTSQPSSFVSDLVFTREDSVGAREAGANGVGVGLEGSAIAAKSSGSDGSLGMETLAETSGSATSGDTGTGLEGTSGNTTNAAVGGGEVSGKSEGGGGGNEGEELHCLVY